MTYALSASGLTPEQIEAPESWSAAPRQFLDAFCFTAHFLNVFALLAILCSALRGGRKRLSAAISPGGASVEAQPGAG